jgi:hypothetical protein
MDKRELMKNGLVVLTMFIVSVSRAQDPDQSVWYTVKVPVALQEKWQLANEAGYRTIHFSSAAYQYFIRTGIRYFLTDNWSVAAGLAFFATRTPAVKFNREFVPEFRLWQEMSCRQNFNPRSFLQYHVRLEQRFFQPTENRNAYPALRGRIKLAFTQMLKDKVGVQVFNEYMHQYDHQHWSFNQNRLTGMLLLLLNNESQLQAGYMWLVRSNQMQQVGLVTFQKQL